MSILFASTRPLKSAHSRTFAAGLLPQREKLPIGPNDADREWAASHLNADTTSYSTEDGDFQTHEARTVSRREWLALQTELATERFVAACDALSDRLGYRTPEEAEIAEVGSQLGHDANPAAVEPTDAPMPWAYVKDANHRTSEAFAAKYNAEKAARKAKEAAATAETTLSPEEIATLERLGESLDHGPEWVWTDAMLDECDAEVAAKDAVKKARKPRPKSMRQIRRAAEKAAKS